MKFQSLLGLILCNVIWSIHPVLARSMVHSFSPAQIALLRYGSALIGFLVVMPVWNYLKCRQNRAVSLFYVPRTRAQGLLLFALGFCAFFLSPMLQLTGLSTSQAVDNSIIIALEPLLTTLFAWLFLCEALPRSYYPLFATAFVGFVLLSGADMNPLHWLGNGLMAFSMVVESTYSIFSRKILGKSGDHRVRRSVPVFGSALAIGFLILLGWLAFTAPHEIVGISHQWSWRAFAIFAWFGPLGTTLTYLYWMVVLQEATVAAMSLTLFIQPVLGLVWGMTFLGESFSLVQGVGSAFILSAVLALGLRGRQKSE